MFMCGEKKILPALNRNYGIRGIIVPEVESELRWSKKFKQRFEAPLEKALGTGTLSVLSEATLASVLSDLGRTDEARSTLFQGIQRRGLEYNRRVGLGEAYTFAAAVELGQPAASNDMDALQILEKAGLPVPEPTLRFFDFIVFGVQTQIVVERQADGMRQTLVRESEWLPRPFAKANFLGGLSSFVPRLLDDSLPGIGAQGTQGSGRASILRIAPIH
jgi:hypothetical protein